MEKKPKLSEFIFGDIRAQKMMEIAARAQREGLPVLLLDVENWATELLTGVEKRDDILD